MHSPLPPDWPSPWAFVQRRDAFLPAVSRPMKDPPLGSRASAVDGRPSSQQGPGVSGAGFDDDYNEWELGIGDLIIDLDADIEKSNDPAMASAAAAAGGPTAAQAVPPPAQAAASSPPVEHQVRADVFYPFPSSGSVQHRCQFLVIYWAASNGGGTAPNEPTCLQRSPHLCCRVTRPISVTQSCVCPPPKKRITIFYVAKTKYASPNAQSLLKCSIGCPNQVPEFRNEPLFC